MKKKHIYIYLLVRVSLKVKDREICKQAFFVNL